LVVVAAPFSQCVKTDQTHVSTHSNINNLNNTNISRPFRHHLGHHSSSNRRRRRNMVMASFDIPQARI
jgi:hypothetical protein